MTGRMLARIRITYRDAVPVRMMSAPETWSRRRKSENHRIATILRLGFSTLQPRWTSVGFRVVGGLGPWTLGSPDPSLGLGLLGVRA